MNSFAGLLLLLSLMMLAMTLRVWYLAAVHSLLWMDAEEAPATGDSLEVVEREIEQRKGRLAELERSGGSGTWTAGAAMSSHRRRLADLKRWRQIQFTGFQCRPLPIKDSTGVHLPHGKPGLALLEEQAAICSTGSSTQPPPHPPQSAAPDR